MINNLDDPKVYAKLDSGRVAESIESLNLQMRQVLDEADAIKVPPGYKRVRQIVVNGMGGSNIGVALVKAALSDKLKAPLIITPGYEVPAMVNENTLYLLSSYSGNTEEVLTVYEEVKKRGAKIMALCQAGNNRLARLALRDKLPGYIFEPKHNPCGQPRLGLGYSVMGAAMLIYKAGLVEIKEKQLAGIIANLELWGRELKPGQAAKFNPAKQLALKLYEKMPVAVGAEFLCGNLKILRNQFNETSKNLAAYLELPDMNHFALEGLVNPKDNQKSLAFLFVDSGLYHPRVLKRAHLTKQVVKKNKIGYIEYRLAGGSKLEQALEMLQFGSWLTYYLAMLNNVNPIKIPWVDWFKKQLDN